MLDFFAYLDDLDLALRVQLLGYSGLYLPDAVAYHIGSATLGDTLHPRVVEYITRNQIYLLTKDYPRPVFMRLLPRIVMYQSLWLMFALRNGDAGRLFPWIDRDGLRGRRTMRQKHRELIARPRISDAEFLRAAPELRAADLQWQQAQLPPERSALLKIYFRFFGKP